jgi:L-aspartate oxidase
MMIVSMQNARTPKVDFLVLGSGIAGVRAAIELAHAGRVLVLSKGDLFESSTEYAQGGIAAALSEDDKVSLHLHDTLQAGDGLCREEAVRVLVEEGPRLIQELIEWGMHFDRNGTKLAFTREGAHSRSRVLHAHGDSTGREILRALMAKAKSLPAIQVQPYAFAVDLLVEDHRICGAQYLDERTSTVKEVHATAVLLATGGLGQVYRETTNPSVACGDGVAIGWRAGAMLSDMEFVQFHPTALYVKGAPRFLLSEALRGEGAQLRNIDLERFMSGYHEAAELAPRDVVSRAIVMEMHKCRSEFVYLDLTGLDPEHIKKRFPRIYSTCLEYNLDITTDLMPVRPAAHYAMGGVATDLDGATNLGGLYAAGEVAATGVHGANRLASNSLLEGLVYGARAARAMIEQKSSSQPGHRAGERIPAPLPSESATRTSAAGPAELEKLVAKVRATMWDKVGIIRSGKELSEAVRRLDTLTLPLAAAPSRLRYETQNMLEVARLIARCALAREESRGAHYRTDFPLKNDAAPPKHSFVAKGTPVTFDQDIPGRSGKASVRASRR